MCTRTGIASGIGTSNDRNKKCPENLKNKAPGMDNISADIWNNNC